VILKVVDANGAPQNVCVAAPGQATDASGVISANLPLGGPFTYQQVIAAPATGVVRSGWFVVNRSADLMYVTEDGSVPGAGNPTSIAVYPGQMFPPPGVGYPVSQNPVYLTGTAGDSFSAKVW
jgi:hypothetical protein